MGAVFLLDESFAEDLALPNGKVYTGYRITRAEPDGLTIMHSAGITKVFFWELPKELQERYRYNPETARDYRQASQQQQSSILQRQQDSMRLDSLQRQYDNARGHVLDAVKKTGGKMVGKVSQVTSNGVFLRNAFFERYYRAAVEIAGVKQMEAQKTYETRATSESVAPSGEPVFVIGAGAGLSDGEMWSGIAYPAGTYNYNTVLGAGKTVKCFATTPEAAADRQIGNP